MALERLANAGYMLNGYLDNTLADAIVIISLVTFASTVIVLGARLLWRQPGVFRTLMLAVTAFVVAVVEIGSIGLVGTKLPYDAVFSSRRQTYYVLCNKLVMTDTAFEVAATSSLLNPVWRHAFDPALLDFSEDGSLTSQPRLHLSGDESILAIERGGQPHGRGSTRHINESD